MGMGCLAGPVVVCAVAIPSMLSRIPGIRDSKQLSAKQREKLSKSLKAQGIRYQIAYTFPKTIDRLNIYQAARKAMHRAVEKLDGDMVLVDGPHPIAGLNRPQQAIIHGDRTQYEISCASILAKVFRDRMMGNYAKRYPEYGFEKHKGYGTKLHKAMLVQFGPSVIHRKSFTPVRQMI